MVRGVRYAKGVVLVLTMEGLTGVDAVTGEKRWRFPVFTPSTDEYVGITDGTYYLCGQESETVPDRVYGIDVRSGQSNWSFDAPPGIVLNGAYGMRDGAVYIVVYNQEAKQREVWAVDAGTRTTRWRVRCPDENTSLSLPEAGPLVYNFGSDIQALDPKTGALVWSRDEDDWGGRTSIGSGFIGGVVVAINGDAAISGLDPRTGAPVWQTTAPPRSGSGLIAASDAYYLCDGSRLTAMRAGGDATPIWSVEVSPSGDALNSGGIAEGETLFFVTDSLRAFDTKTGNVRWSHPLSEQPTGMDTKIAVGDGRCYIENGGMRESTVIALVQ